MRALFFVTLAALASIGASCMTDDRRTPTPTGAVCPTPDPMTLTWDNFGQPFTQKYCIWCHSDTLTHSAQRNGAPFYHDYDNLELTLEIANHTDEEAGSGPNADNNAMPPSRCPSEIGGSLDHDCLVPTEAERVNLSVWLACEVDRPHNF